MEELAMSQMIYGWVAGITTLISMIAFLGVVAWSYSRRRRDAFDELARMPLEEDTRQTPGAQS
jgi:cytochrome c oxidase cbb3-type subunit 4